MGNQSFLHVDYLSAPYALIGGTAWEINTCPKFHGDQNEMVEDWQNVWWNGDLQRKFLRILSIVLEIYTNLYLASRRNG